MTIWRIHISCWISKATNTHSQYVLFIDFPLQQMLHERASMLRYTYIACLDVLYKHGFVITMRFPSVNMLIIIDNAEGI